MILPFSTKLKGKSTYFVEKIQKALKAAYFPNIAFSPEHCLTSFDYVKFAYCKPKLHSLRDDTNDRWHKGIMIDFFINVRQKNMFRFAPRVPVVSTQEVFMTYYCNDIIEISVDGNYINNITEFAINDGFDNWQDFFNYFYPKIKAAKNECYKPKLIHWTDLRY